MVNINTYEEWCAELKKALATYEQAEFDQAKKTMKTLMWYNTPFNAKRRIIPYVNGSKAAAALFNVKAGSWVLKHEGKGYRKCPLC